MTQEEKAKRYDEALEKGREVYNRGYYVSGDLEYIFPEFKESEDEKVRKALIELVKCNERSGYTLLNNVSTSSMLDWLEKQGEQKPADNFKQKFKVGDWVTNGLCAWRIDSIDEDMYYTNHRGIDCGGDIKSIDEEYHIWTIQDAKDGDVLAEDTCTFIIKELNHDLTAEIYCCLYDDGDFELNSNLGFDDTCTYPATKEQRDLLFQKMEESGYEWDADKKELKIVDWSKHIKYNPNAPSIIKENPAWSEEDEEFSRRAINAAKDVYPMTANWLKSLKERCAWKPSDEQMHAFEQVYDWYNNNFAPSETLTLLYNDLEKLKGE